MMTAVLQKPGGGPRVQLGICLLPHEACKLKPNTVCQRRILFIFIYSDSTVM